MNHKLQNGGPTDSEGWDLYRCPAILRRWLARFCGRCKPARRLWTFSANNVVLPQTVPSVEPPIAINSTAKYAGVCKTFPFHAKMSNQRLRPAPPPINASTSPPPASGRVRERWQPAVTLPPEHITGRPGMMNQKLPYHPRIFTKPLRPPRKRGPGAFHMPSRGQVPPIDNPSLCASRTEPGQKKRVWCGVGL